MTQVQLNKIKRFWNPQKAVSQIANIYKFENNYNENYDAWYWYKILLTFCPDFHNILVTIEICIIHFHFYECYPTVFCVVVVHLCHIYK